MAQQNFSITDKNDKWLKEPVDIKEYASKSELVNDLIRQSRHQQKEIDWVRAKLDRAEHRGFSNRNPEEILETARDGR